MANLPRFIDHVEHAQLCAELRDMGYSEAEAQSMVDEVNMGAEDARIEMEMKDEAKREYLEDMRNEYEIACTQTFHLNSPGSGGLEYDPYF